MTTTTRPNIIQLTEVTGLHKATFDANAGAHEATTVLSLMALRRGETEHSLRDASARMQCAAAYLDRSARCMLDEATQIDGVVTDGSYVQELEHTLLEMSLDYKRAIAALGYVGERLDDGEGSEWSASLLAEIERIGPHDDGWHEHAAELLGEEL